MASLKDEPIGNEIKQPRKPLENHMIPKHRFDCVNLCLKETKETLRKKTLEAEEHKAHIAELKAALLNAEVDTLLARHRAKDATAVKALMDLANMDSEDEAVMSDIEEQIIGLKKSRSYLFANELQVSYVLVPVESDDPLNRSIANYIKRSRRTER